MKMNIENSIVQVDQNGVFKKTFFYKGDDRRINPIRNHPGIAALQQAIDRNKALPDETKEAPVPASTLFQISGNRLKLMHDSYSYEPVLIYGGQDKVDGYRLANTIGFNSFKIFFKRELDALGLDTKCK